MGCCHCAPRSIDINIIVVPQNDFAFVCCTFHTKIDNNVVCFRPIKDRSLYLDIISVKEIMKMQNLNPVNC